jgi:hypothetical protein
MDAATVRRIISLIPDRSAWTPSGALFTPEGKSERVALIARLMHWLSPLEALSVENQHFLGLRANGARPPDAEAEDAELGDDLDEPSTPMRLPGAGTQIAA